MLKRILVTLLVLSAVLVGGVWWAVHSQTAFEWAIAAIVQRFGGVVVIEGAHGTLEDVDAGRPLGARYCLRLGSAQRPNMHRVMRNG